MCVAPDPVARLVVGVPQGRGRLDSEAGEGAAEKSTLGDNAVVRTKTDTGR